MTTTAGSAPESAWFSDLRSRFTNFVSSALFNNDWSRRKADASLKPLNPTMFCDGSREFADSAGTARDETEFNSVTEAIECGNDPDGSIPWFEIDQSHYDTLEMQHFGSLEGLIPVGKRDLGVGHDFHIAQFNNPTWCDKCGDFIWGFFKQAVKCSKCNYSCHYKCRMLVTLDCSSVVDSLKSQKTSATFMSADGAAVDSSASSPDSSLPTEGPDDIVSEFFLTYRSSDFVDAIGDRNVGLAALGVANIVPQTHPDELDKDEPGSSPSTPVPQPVEFTVEFTQTHSALTPCLSEPRTPSLGAASLPPDLPLGDALTKLIELHNETANDGLKMVLEENKSSVRGFIRIHMNFGRPVNVIAGERPPTIYDVIESGPDAPALPASGRKTIASFYLPRNVVKILHITSDTTTQEMIVALLKKFRVADNPRKFALYERDMEPGKTLKAKLCRISDTNCPLRLALLWGADTTKRFVLQENETGDINWDAFEIPELNNFLRILEREEKLYMQEIKFSYQQYRMHVASELKERKRRVDVLRKRSRDATHLPNGQSRELIDTAVAQLLDGADGVDSASSALIGQNPSVNHLTLKSDWSKSTNDDDATIKSPTHSKTVPRNAEESYSDNEDYDSGTMIIRKG